MELIVYTDADGGLVECYPAPGFTAAEILKKDCSTAADPIVIDDSKLPQDQVFRDAWVKVGRTVVEDLGKTKELLHKWRRIRRGEEFAPYDEVIMKQIPGIDAVEAEAARAAIRTKYEDMQVRIEAASDVEVLRTIYDKEIA